MYGEGTYFTDIEPSKILLPGESMTPAMRESGFFRFKEALRVLFGSAQRGAGRMQGFVELDPHGLNVIRPDPLRPHILMVRGGDLDVANRVRATGSLVAPRRSP